MYDEDTAEAFRHLDREALDYDAQDALDAADAESFAALLGYTPRPGVKRGGFR